MLVVYVVTKLYLTLNACELDGLLQHDRVGTVKDGITRLK